MVVWLVAFDELIRQMADGEWIDYWSFIRSDPILICRDRCWFRISTKISAFSTIRHHPSPYLRVIGVRGHLSGICRLLRVFLVFVLSLLLLHMYVLCVLFSYLATITINTVTIDALTTCICTCVILGSQRFFSPCWYDQRFGQTLGPLKRRLRTPYCFLCKTNHTEDKLSSKGLFCWGVM